MVSNRIIAQCSCEPSRLLKHSGGEMIHIFRSDHLRTSRRGRKQEEEIREKTTEEIVFIQCEKK